MHTRDLTNWQHDHVFGHDKAKAAEKRTLLIVAVTTVMMVVEIAAGILYGSMALLADGLHMASHAVALGIAALAYIYARHLAADRRFTFGTGKINSLAGFASAVLLGGFAFVMVLESVGRLIDPVEVIFDYALLVAVIGLLVNGGSAWLLSATPHHHDTHGAHSHHEADYHHDHNLRAAYFHVLADALTSLLAIVALLMGKYFGAVWLDPVMGIAGAILVVHWSYGLLKETAAVLVDTQADVAITRPLRAAIEEGTQDRISDLHVWSIGQGQFAAEIAIVSDKPKAPDYYRQLIPSKLHIMHVTIEVHLCTGH